MKAAHDHILIAVVERLEEYWRERKWGNDICEGGM